VSFPLWEKNVKFLIIQGADTDTDTSTQKDGDESDLFLSNILDKNNKSSMISSIS